MEQLRREAKRGMLDMEVVGLTLGESLPFFGDYHSLQEFVGHFFFAVRVVGTASIAPRPLGEGEK
jgi:hypothetical protein